MGLNGAVRMPDPAVPPDAAGPFDFTRVSTPTDAVRTIDLVERIWGGSAGVDVNTLIALDHSDNYVMLAERDGDAVAVGIAFCGPPRSRNLHSHIVGASVPGAGRALKYHQRDWCRERGIETITWTFDPLIARNAWFNLGVLGARPVEYLVDHYGRMDDGLNAGQPSDRLLVSWPVATDPGLPTLEPEVGRIALPDDLEQIRRTDPDAALDWRLRVREQFAELIASGHDVIGFARPDSNRGGEYLLARSTQSPTLRFHPAPATARAAQERPSA
ncbi:putative GNAT superfamily acetyltransferase [Naumannella halotolerans]|uniref:Putative GNAT superfamily acetyltransferase n=2 Tax=Naumannella halotolerans TaxID=993414 RepID=A0A4R7J8H5_9ACTN|nr:putative GNAT superfamily acetyltransferase [Naumannella halotolerans]